MITNYIKIAFRNFYRNKAITLIKMIGLALGLAVTFFILIYISTETSYNNYFKSKGRIFRVNQINYLHDWKTMQTPYPMRDALIEEFPEIKSATRIISLNEINIIDELERVPEQNFICVDKSFFEIFNLELIYGDLSGFSVGASNLVLTESTALKYFGKVDIVGEFLKADSKGAEYIFDIVAVIKDIPLTTTIKFDFIANTEFGLLQANNILRWSDGMDREIEFYRTDWETNFLQTYILFESSKNAFNVSQGLKEFEAKHLKDTTERDYYIQKLEDIYLHSKDVIGSYGLGDLKSIYIFSVIAFLVLLIACINYIILSVSQIIARTKEIGIRKIVGATQSDLFKQITIESLFIIFVTLPIAFVLIEQSRPLLAQIIGKEILLTYNIKFIVGFISILLFVVLIPGLNITYYLNRISPITILRKSLHNSVQKFNLRKVLIVLQFVIFIVLVVLALGIKLQLDFSTQQGLGFNPRNKVMFHVAKLVKQGKYEALKSELLKAPDIKDITGAMWLPPSNGRMSLSYSDSNFLEPLKLEALFVDNDFIETFDLKLLRGKSLSEFTTNAEHKIVVNEEAEKLIGPENLIGRTIWNGEVVGVINNFRFHSVHEKIQPMILIVGEFMVREIVLNFNDEVTAEQIVKLKNKVGELFPGLEIEPEFLEDRFNVLYEKEKQLQLLIVIFSGVAIFIASMGLLGLTIFNTKKQGKNIAIRKVNGASSLMIWKLLVSDYIKLITIALLIAVPIAYYLINKWLQGFAYQADIDWWIFLTAGGLALIISLLTVSWYILNAARKNSVTSLRYE